MTDHHAVKAIDGAAPTTIFVPGHILETAYRDAVRDALRPPLWLTPRTPPRGWHARLIRWERRHIDRQARRARIKVANLIGGPRLHDECGDW